MDANQFVTDCNACVYNCFPPSVTGSVNHCWKLLFLIFSSFQLFLHVWRMASDGSAVSILTSAVFVCLFWTSLSLWCD